MKIVTLNRALRPWGKDDQAVLPDDMAQRLVDSGEAREGLVTELQIHSQHALEGCHAAHCG